MTTRFRILVVDDEPVNIKVMTSALGAEYDVIPALNGFDAISLLRERAPDLILLDVLMPELSGFDVCSIIKSDEEFIDIPVIFLTAYDTEEGELRGLALGGIDYLTKPINYDLLRQRVRNHVVQKSRTDLIKSQVNQLARQKEELAHMLVEMRKLSRAVEQSPVSIVITDTKGMIEFVNPTFTEITGYSAQEAAGQNLRIVKSGLTPPETYQSLWSTITAGKIWEGEFINKRRDGSLFWENAKISALRDDDGTITHYLGVKEDITEKKSTMEQLVQSQKMESIGQLAGGLAHDLNNILSVVSGYTALAQHGMDREQKQFGYLDKVIRATSRAASLTHSLMAYSRKQVMSQQIQDLNLLITDVGSFISHIIYDNITFTLSLAAEPLGVYVDTTQIEQVLLNFATNARDAMPDGGTFTITTAAGSMDEQFIATHNYGTIGRYAIITVTDSGHGMDEETRHKAFNPFFTTKEIGKGTGLGLPMVLGIIKQHGGFIDLQSEPGVGSVFQFYLPLVDTGDVAAEAAELHLQMESGSGTILVAEDDEETRSAVAEFLTRAGYTVISAIDGQDAVEKFAAHSGTINLVISDVVMPRKSGKMACDEIRQMSENVKFIFVSGHADNVIEREGILAAHTQIIIKPILPFDMLRKIKELI
jgi:PAS domain S-box-containing protein